MRTQNFSPDLVFAMQTARQAGKILSRHRNRLVGASWVRQNELKTLADKEVDEFISRQLQGRFPGDSVTSEELPDRLGTTDRTWVVDPIDGTINWRLQINDLFCICLALCLGREPVMGVIYFPATNEMFTAEKGQGAYLNGKRIRPSDETSVGHVIMYGGSGKHNKMSHFPFVMRLHPHVNACSSDIFSHASGVVLTACGRLHAYFATDAENEDLAAAAVIAQEAGCQVTNFDGGPWRLGDRTVLVANHALHPEIKRLMEI